jgi:hypothetical protein
VTTPVADKIPAVTEMALFYPSGMALVTGQVGTDGLDFAEAFLRFMEACSTAAREIQDEAQRVSAGLILCTCGSYEMCVRHERFDWDKIMGVNAELLLWIFNRYNYDVRTEIHLLHAASG